MKYFLNDSKLISSAFKSALLRLTLLTLGLLTLAACNLDQLELTTDIEAADSAETAPATTETGPAHYDYSLSVEIDAQNSREEVAARYGGEVIVWRPEAGFAVLGLSEDNGHSLRTQNLASIAVEPNQNQVVAPEAEVEASRVWGEGRNAWSGGRNAWSGGDNTWYGGINSEPALLWQSAWWQIELADGLTDAPRAGQDVKVAVIDSGLDLPHPAFRDRLAPESEWKDFVDGDARPQEERLQNGDNSSYGHGTGVAGVVLQVAPNATILPLRVLDSSGLGDITDVAAAIDHAVAWGADIINLSLGTDEDSDVLNDMIAYAAKRKIFVIASSGNTGDENITYPARNARDRSQMGAYLMSVGSIGNDNRKSSFSTYGDALELFAPGEYIHTVFPENKVSYWSGTSFAAPMVTGTLALVLGENGEEYNTSKKLDWLANKASMYDFHLNVRNFVSWAKR